MCENESSFVTRPRKRGAPGWSYPEVLPYFKRSEGNGRLGAPYHNSAGPLSVVDPVWVSGLADRFVAPGGVSGTADRFVASAAQLGVPATDDFNGAEQEGAGVVQVTQKRGRR